MAAATHKQPGRSSRASRTTPGMGWARLLSVATGVAWPTWRGSPGVRMVFGAIKGGSSMLLGGLAWELKLDPWAGRDTPWFSPYDMWGVAPGLARVSGTSPPPPQYDVLWRIVCGVCVRRRGIIPFVDTRNPWRFFFFFFKNQSIALSLRPQQRVDFSG